MPCKLGDSTAELKSYLGGFGLAIRALKRDTENVWGICFTHRIDTDGGVSKIKELVEAGNDDRPDKTENPRTQGRRWHRGIIGVCNRNTDFWIWGLILERRGRRVKIWVVIVIDSSVLSVPD